MNLEPPFTLFCKTFFSKIRRDLFFIDARVSVRVSISLLVSAAWHEASKLVCICQIQKKMK